MLPLFFCYWIHQHFYVLAVILVLKANVSEQTLSPYNNSQAKWFTCSRQALGVCLALEM